jgi:2-pyrone-4,6-dicarboxylate lactonase
MVSTSLQKPRFTLPPLACDAHCHIFGPANAFPYSASRKYTPEDAPKSQLFALHQGLGFERSVLVQASCHGTDNRSMIDMLNDAQGRYRGVAIIDEGFKAKDLLELHQAGVRGVRFNFLTRLVDVKPREFYLRIADQIADFGWHIVVYFESEHLPNIIELLNELPVPIVIDHLGRPDVSLPIENENFQLICSLLFNNKKNYIKVSCIERLTKVGAPYSDVLPFAKYLVEHFPDQVLWGTDWPHPNMEGNIPNDTLLVDSIPLMAETIELQKKLLVDNPHRLYCFE